MTSNHILMSGAPEGFDATIVNKEAQQGWGDPCCARCPSSTGDAGGLRLFRTRAARLSLSRLGLPAL